MKTDVQIRLRTQCAWMRVEIIFVVFIAAFIALMVLPATVCGTGKKVRASRIKCINNLKNVGLAMRVFATDHEDRYPMELPLAQGGTRELVNDPTLVWLHFAAVSNELNTPKLLLCPSDTAGRIETATFDRTFRTSLRQPFSQNAHVSYFLGLDASELNPHSLLAGDRNLDWPEAGLAYGTARVTALGTNHSVKASAVGPGWDGNVHKHSGNVVMGDGSVQQFNHHRLREALRDSGDPLNRVAVPD